MDLDDYLAKLTNEDCIFLFLEPDASYDKDVFLCILSSQTNFQIKLNPTAKDFKVKISKLKIALNSKFIFGWNVKNIISYILKYSNKLFDIKILDLKIIEYFLFEHSIRPTTFSEAKQRLNKCFKSSGWEKYKLLHNEIYEPLTNEIIPVMENIGFINKKINKKLYPYYEIEGQKNGRFKSYKINELSINVHNLSNDDKNDLYVEHDYNFIYLDYKSMEVVVLQWLSEDKVLGNILKSGDDIYNRIWKEITGINDASYRDICKSIFLPIMFGMGANTISERLNVSFNSASSLIDKVKIKFSQSYDWISNNENLIKDGIFTDIFGRTRKFDGNDLYKVRNFSVQSPAATICQHKLVKLYNAVKNSANVISHIHDGFILSCKQSNLDKVISLSKKILEDSESLYLNLNLTIDCKVGKKLNILERYYV